MAPFRFLLRSKSTHSDLLVPTAKQAMEHSPLELHTLPQSEILTLVHDLLASLHRNTAIARDLLRRCQRTIEALLWRLEHLGRKAPLASLLARERIARQNQLHSPRLANRIRQSLATSRTRDRPQLNLRLPKVGARAAVHDICHHGEFASTAQCMPIDCADDGLLDLRSHVGPQLDEVVAVGRGEGQVLHLFDVGAGGEGALAACDDDGADGRVAIVGFEGAIEFVEERRAEGVEGFRAVELD